MQIQDELNVIISVVIRNNYEGKMAGKKRFGRGSYKRRISIKQILG
jgi:hypothetical protein